MTDWLAFSAIEPIGEERADYRAGVIAAVMTNKGRHKSTPPVQVQDFMPFLDKPTTLQAGKVLKVLSGFKSVFKKAKRK